MGSTTAFSARPFTVPRLAVVFLFLLGLYFFCSALLSPQQSFRALKSAQGLFAANGPSPTDSVAKSIFTSYGYGAAQPSGQAMPTRYHGLPIPPRPSAVPAVPAVQPNCSNVAMESKNTPSEEAPPNGCPKMVGAERIMIILKTGATEIYQKLPTHFVTTFKCAPHFMIFSDLNQTYANYEIHDAIAPVSRSLRDEHPDFELYRKLEQYQREGQDMSLLSGETGWNLDKWKFLPMLHMAFEKAPDIIEWFVVIEADTSLSWPNLLQLLRRKNPLQPHYMGSQAFINDLNFAHGGSGFIISREAAKQLEAKRNSTGLQAYDRKWEEYTRNTCCGDEAVAAVFRDAGINLTPIWPIIQGETLSSIDWSQRHWCAPAVSWHHVSPSEIDALWQFDMAWMKERGLDTPYLFRDVFEQFISRHVSVNRTQWNNLSHDRKFVAPTARSSGEEVESFEGLMDFERASVKSKEACAFACERLDDGLGWCVQWMFRPGRCYLSRVVQFGNRDESNEHGVSWTSGWIQGRVEDYKRSFGECEIEWQEQQ